MPDVVLPEHPDGIFRIAGKPYRLNLNPYGERSGHLHDRHGDTPSDLCPACTRDHEFTVGRSGSSMPWSVSCSCGQFSTTAFDNDLTLSMTIHLRVALDIEGD